MRSLDDYREVVGDKVIGEIYQRARRFQGESALQLQTRWRPL